MLQNELTNTESFSYSNRRDLSDAQKKVARELTDKVEQGCSVSDKLNAMSPQERVAIAREISEPITCDSDLPLQDIKVKVHSWTIDKNDNMHFLEPEVIDVYNKPLEKPNSKARIHHAWMDQELR